MTPSSDEIEFARDTLCEWFDYNFSLLYTAVEKSNLKSSPGRAVSVDLTLNTHTISICAWDQGNRLEITIVDRKSGEAKIDDEGYSTKSQLIARLETFMEQFQKMDQ